MPVFNHEHSLTCTSSLRLIATVDINALSVYLSVLQALKMSVYEEKHAHTHQNKHTHTHTAPARYTFTGCENLSISQRFRLIFIQRGTRQTSWLLQMSEETPLKETLPFIIIFFYFSVFLQRKFDREESDLASSRSVLMTE